MAESGLPAVYSQRVCLQQLLNLTLPRPRAGRAAAGYCEGTSAAASHTRWCEGPGREQGLWGVAGRQPGEGRTTGKQGGQAGQAGGQEYRQSKVGWPGLGWRGGGAGGQAGKAGRQAEGQGGQEKAEGS